jgi:hypothetical protein
MEASAGLILDALLDDGGEDNTFNACAAIIAVSS